MYSRARPYTWEVREQDHRWWTRFYMLPEGKRPIETDEERVTALERARRIVNAIFDQDAVVTLVIGEPKRSDLPPHLLSLDPSSMTTWLPPPRVGPPLAVPVCSTPSYMRRSRRAGSP